MSTTISTRFLNPGPMVDGDLTVRLRDCLPGNAFTGRASAYRFDLVGTQTQACMGSIDLRLGDDDYLRLYAGQVGYNVDAPFRGHHFAARSVRILLPLARLHGLNPLWITCNPDNFASRRTCELAGGELEEIVDVPPTVLLYHRGERQKCRYRISL
ncbi:MAG: GNAT family N-acetyltransferase [Planctomycetota bacterium]|nr:GNAT family N-acetyltransferase [Planctomycetota bacterium]